jgi:hypothetical protein
LYVTPPAPSGEHSGRIVRAVPGENAARMSRSFAAEYIRAAGA